MSRHRDQHFLPIDYLKPWLDPESLGSRKLTPYVWIFDKDGTNPRNKAPKKVFQEPEMYTRHADGKRDVGLEKVLGRLETGYRKCIRPKLKALETLSSTEHKLLCLYIAAAHARTPARRAHLSSMWRGPLEKMKELKEVMKTATPEQKKAMASAPRLSRGPGLNEQQVQYMVDQPLQCLMLPEVRTLGPKLTELNFAVLETNDEIGFITSDRPCLLYDPEAYKRHPFYRAPSLDYRSTEVTFPISPSQCILLSRSSLEGYFDVPAEVVDDINRRTRFLCHKHFVVRKNQTRPAWFAEDDEPEDSWEKSQQ